MINLFLFRITGKVSGAETYNSYLTKGLRSINDIAITIVSNNRDFLELFQDPAVRKVTIHTPVYEVGTLRNFLKFIFILPIYYLEFFVFFLRNVHKEGKLFCFQSMSEKLFFTPLLRLLGMRVVWIEHGRLFCTERAPIIKVLYRLISGSTHGIIAVSQSTKEDLIAGGVKDTLISVIYIGIDGEGFRNDATILDRKLEKKPDGITIGYVGSIDMAKGVYDFVTVVGELHKKDKRVTGLLVGDGYELENLQAHIKKNHMEDFIMTTGYKESPRRFFRHMDMFLFLTRNEGLSIALLEAVFNGCYIICTDVGGNREIVSSDTIGKLIPFEDVSSILVITNIVSEVIRKKSYKRTDKDRLNVYETFDLHKQARMFAEHFRTV